jgi:hypothetical protein
MMEEFSLGDILQQLDLSPTLHLPEYQFASLKSLSIIIK